MARVYRFEDLQAEYAGRWRDMKIDAGHLPAVDKVCARLLRDKQTFLSIESQVKVPAALVAAWYERECSATMVGHMHNGDSLQHRTHNVPAHRLPDAEPPYSLPQSAFDALVVMRRLDRVAGLPGGWMIERAAFETEGYNGFGPRMRGKTSGYLWSFSDQYKGGKYVADGDWSAGTWDAQIGVMPILARLVALDPSLAFWKGTPHVAAGDHPMFTKLPAPKPEHDTKWLQAGLNELHAAGLLAIPDALDVDGDYGAKTHDAVVAFQRAVGILDDGRAGRVTNAKLESKLAALAAAPPKV